MSDLIHFWTRENGKLRYILAIPEGTVTLECSEPLTAADLSELNAAVERVRARIQARRRQQAGLKGGGK
ncbi:MAG TPA: hypothetical protein VKF17_16670 [Isosphaeraceae bacterium]|nr:hypothetical protein [Isosphaeraceae bacterium]